MQNYWSLVKTVSVCPVNFFVYFKIKISIHGNFVFETVFLSNYCLFVFKNHTEKYDQTWTEVNFSNK